MNLIIKKTSSSAVLSLLLGTAAFSVDAIDSRITAGHIGVINVKFERQMGLTLSQQEARQAAQDLFINCTPAQVIKNKILDARAKQVADYAVQQRATENTVRLMAAAAAPETVVVTVVPPVVLTPIVTTPVVVPPALSIPKARTPKVHTPKVHTPKVYTPKVHTLKAHAPKVHAPKVHTPKKNPLKVTTLKSNTSTVIPFKASENNQLLIGTKTFVFNQNTKDQVFNFVINNEVMKNILLSNIILFDKNAKKEEEALRKIIENFPALYAQMNRVQKNNVNLFLINLAQNNQIEALRENESKANYQNEVSGVLSLSLNTSSNEIPLHSLKFSGVDGYLMSEGDHQLEKLSNIISEYPTIALIREYNTFEDLFSTNPIHAERMLTSNIISKFGNHIFNLVKTEKNTVVFKKSGPKIIPAIEDSKPRAVEISNENVIEPKIDASKETETEENFVMEELFGKYSSEIAAAERNSSGKKPTKIDLTKLKLSKKARMKKAAQITTAKKLNKLRKILSSSHRPSNTENTVVLENQDTQPSIETNKVKAGPTFLGFDIFSFFSNANSKPNQTCTDFKEEKTSEKSYFGIGDYSEESSKEENSKEEWLSVGGDYYQEGFCEGEHSEGEHSEGEYSEEEHSEEEHSEEEHSEEEHSEEEHSEEEHSEGEHSEGEHSEGEHSEEEHSEEEHSEGEHSEEEHSEGEHSEGEHSEGEHSEENSFEENSFEEKSSNKENKPNQNAINFLRIVNDPIKFAKSNLKSGANYLREKFSNTK